MHGMGTEVGDKTGRREGGNRRLQARAVIVEASAWAHVLGWAELRSEN